MSLQQASKEKKKVKLAVSEPVEERTLKLLPEKLCDLIARSRKLQEKVLRIDSTIHAPPPEQPPGASPLDQHLGLLKAAFERTDA